MSETLLERSARLEPLLKNVIDKCGTREQAAAVARVQVRTVYNWLAGRTEPTFVQGLALCRHAGVDPLTVSAEPAKPQPPREGPRHPQPTDHEPPQTRLDRRNSPAPR